MTNLYFSILFLLPFSSLLGVEHGPFTGLSLENGILVEVSERQNKNPWVRATGEINAPAAKIAHILSDFQNYGKLFSECFASARVLEIKSEGARLHIVWRYPIFFRNRDAIALYEIQKNSNGTYRLNWRGDSRPGDPSEGVRINQVEGNLEIVPLGATQSRLIYQYIGDIGGDFPKAIKEAAWKRHPLHYFQAIKNKVEKHSDLTP